MNNLRQVDLKNKKVLLRVDLDVPVSEDKISEPFRVRKQKSMVNFLLNKGAKVVMMAHISVVDSFKLILSQLEEIFNYRLILLNDLETVNWKLETGNLFLLDNIRKWPAEKENSREFAEQIAKGFDFYINNDFAVSHRKHASVSAVTQFLPSYAGFLLEEEILQLEKVINSSKDGKTIIIGGAKAENKISVIKNLLDKCDKILIGGVIANDILKFRGKDIGDSVVDLNTEDLLAGLELNSQKLIIPVDSNIFENRILDIGPGAIREFSEIIQKSKIIIWNGPVGLFEDERFSAGTYDIARAIANSRAFRVLGGGDTIAAVNKLGLLDKFDFVSTGGGAMLAFLAGDKLPGLAALGYYKE